MAEGKYIFSERERERNAAKVNSNQLGHLFFKSKINFLYFSGIKEKKKSLLELLPHEKKGKKSDTVSFALSPVSDEMEMYRLPPCLTFLVPLKICGHKDLHAVLQHNTMPN